MMDLHIRKPSLELWSVWSHLARECETRLQFAGMSDYTEQLIVLYSQGSGQSLSRLLFSLLTEEEFAKD